VDALRSATLALEEAMNPEDDKELFYALTRALRAADQTFEKVGGSSRHFVADCLMPALEAEGLLVVWHTSLEARVKRIEECLEGVLDTKLRTELNGIKGLQVEQIARRNPTDCLNYVSEECRDGQPCESCTLWKSKTELEVSIRAALARVESKTLTTGELADHHTIDRSVKEVQPILLSMAGRGEVQSGGDWSWTLTPKGMSTYDEESRR
jgi:hypothetical protein